jgi:anti-sigma B factor antagonist
MPQLTVSMDVRTPSEVASIIDIVGDVTAACEDVLMSTYSQASGTRTRAIILNFGGLVYMNSSGIGLLVMLLVRVRRQHQQLMAFDLNPHYCEIFALTRLDEAIAIYGSEQDALAAAAHVAV